MILLCGIPSETPLRLVADELTELGADVVWFNQRQFADMSLEFNVEAGQVTGVFRSPDRAVSLEDITGVYVRLMDDRELPELEDEPDGSPARMRCRELHDALAQWFEICPALVLNRYGPMGSNGSKPYQAQTIVKHGFYTPETLVTNDPDAVREFAAEQGRLIYKSASGTRSIVTELSERDMGRLDSVTTCPTQFQACVDGYNVRVHVVKDQVFATAIDAEGIDYRYSAKTTGQPADLRPIDISDDLAAACVALSADLELTFSGIDLMVDGDERVYCLEVNPSPAYSYYEHATGQPISAAVAHLLAAT